MRLSLRALDEAKDTELRAVKLGDLLEAPEPVAAAPTEAPKVNRIKVRRANEVEVVELN